MRYFEDIELGVAIEAGPYRVAENEIVAFAKEWDPRPFHTDPEAARATPLRGLAASGAHTIAIYHRLLFEAGARREALAGIANAGLELKLPHPVRPGDQLMFRSEPIEKRDSRRNPRVGVARFRGTLTNQDGRVVLEAVATGLFEKRPTG